MVYWLDAGWPLLSQLLRSPTALPLGNLLGRPGDAERCWVMLGLLGAAGCISGSVCWGRIAITGAITGAVVDAVVTTTATAATVLQYDVRTTCLSAARTGTAVG